MPILTSLLVLAAASGQATLPKQTGAPKVSPGAVKLLRMPKVAFLPTRSDYSSTEKYMKSKDAIDGMNLGVRKPTWKPAPYQFIGEGPFYGELAKQALINKTTDQWLGARAAAKAVGADYAALVTITSAEMIKNPKQYYVVVKADLMILKVDSPTGKVVSEKLAAINYGPRRDLDTSTMPTAREAAFELGRSEVGKWFATNKHKMD